MNHKDLLRFQKKLDIVSNGADGCWIWQGHKRKDGYGRFWRQGSCQYAHRISYEIFHGPISNGLVIDHQCRNRICVRPDHIRAVNIRTNCIENSMSGPVVNSLKTHCPKGHGYTKDNTYIHPDGSRRCRVCRIEYKRKWQRTNRNKYNEYQRNYNKSKHIPIGR